MYGETVLDFEKYKLTVCAAISSICLDTILKIYYISNN